MIGIRAAATALLMTIATATVVSAQTTVEVYGGLSAPRTPRSGSLTLPAAGPPILTSNPIFPSRQTATWFLGDGASLINDAVADLGILNRVAPIDSALSRLPFDAPVGGAFGARVRFRVKTRYELEGSIDVLASRTHATADLSSAIGKARSSFQDTFTALFASGPFTNTTVDAASTVDPGSSRRVALTGALVVPLGARRGLSPYLTVGGGLISAFGNGPSISLVGHYRTVVHAGVPVIDAPLEEFDRLTIKYEEGRSPVALGGAGVTRSIGRTWSLRIDGRVLIGPNTARVRVDAAPSGTTGSPAGFIELFTLPALEFSNNASTGRQSTLSGAGLHDATIFEGSGVAARTIVTVGVVKRF